MTRGELNLVHSCSFRESSNICSQRKRSRGSLLFMFGRRKKRLQVQVWQATILRILWRTRWLVGGTLHFAGGFLAILEEDRRGLLFSTVKGLLQRIVPCLSYRRRIASLSVVYLSIKYNHLLVHDDHDFFRSVWIQEEIPPTAIVFEMKRVLLLSRGVRSRPNYYSYDSFVLFHLFVVVVTERDGPWIHLLFFSRFVANFSSFGEVLCDAIGKESQLPTGFLKNKNIHISEPYCIYPFTTRCVECHHVAHDSNLEFAKNWVIGKIIPEAPISLFVGTTLGGVGCFTARTKKRILAACRSTNDIDGLIGVVSE